MECPSIRDVLLHYHLVPAFIMLAATTLVSVQGRTLTAVYFGIILFLQVLFSVSHFSPVTLTPGEPTDGPFKNEVAYIVSFVYGLSIQFISALIVSPAGVLLCVAFASMTVYYCPILTFCSHDEVQTQAETDDSIDAI